MMWIVVGLISFVFMSRMSQITQVPSCDVSIIDGIANLYAHLLAYYSNRPAYMSLHSLLITTLRLFVSLSDLRRVKSSSWKPALPEDFLQFMEGAFYVDVPVKMIHLHNSQYINLPSSPSLIT